MGLSGAASVVKATRMDRPEWIVVSPTDGQVYCTLTNNAKRGEEGQPVGGPNPREKNVYGQILRWKADADNHGATDFTWDLFVVAGNPGVHAGNPKGGSSNINPQNMFNSPDGLGFDKAGRLWILTDGDYSNAGDFAGMGNNQMLATIPGKTIVLTGALNPARFEGSDAEFNIGCAVGAVQSLPPGVYIAMNGRIWDPRKVRKNVDANRFEAAG